MTKTELATLLPLIIKSAEYIELDPIQATLIRHADSKQELVHIENETNTVNFLGESIPDCAPNHTRLWDNRYWVITENKRNALKAESAARHKAWQQAEERREKLHSRLVAYFGTIGLTAEMVSKLGLIKGTNAELEALIQGIQNTGANI